MKTIQKFWELSKGKIEIFTVAILIIVALFAVAVIAEKLMSKREGYYKVSVTKKITMIAMFAAVAAVLMYVEFPLWFAPADMYKLDLSEIPVLICGFILGPVSGVACEFVKILIKIVIKPTSTAFVGEFANFLVGCAFVVPASIVYQLKKTRKNALLGMGLGTVILTVIGSVLNALFLIPVFAVFYGMPVDVIVSIGNKLNSAVTDITTFAVMIVAPFNLFKGVLVSVITFLIYKPISKILKVRL